MNTNDFEAIGFFIENDLTVTWVEIFPNGLRGRIRPEKHPEPSSWYRVEEDPERGSYLDGPEERYWLSKLKLLPGCTLPTRKVRPFFVVRTVQAGTALEAISKTKAGKFDNSSELVLSGEGLMKHLEELGYSV